MKADTQTAPADVAEEEQRLRPDDKEPDLEKGEAGQEAEDEPEKAPVSVAFTLKSFLTILPLVVLGVGAVFVLVPMVRTPLPLSSFIELCFRH